jgi:hypothetical protein
MPPGGRDFLDASPRRSTPMPPKSSPPEQPELFRSALANLVDRRNPLVRLAGLIDWERFATAFGPLYREGAGRPGLPTRLMVGLHLINVWPAPSARGFAILPDQSTPTYPVSGRSPGQDGDPRAPVLISTSASSAID